MQDHHERNPSNAVRSAAVADHVQAGGISHPAVAPLQLVEAPGQQEDMPSGQAQEVGTASRPQPLQAWRPAAAPPVVQCISLFSRWFIEKVLIPLLEEVLQEDEQAPEALEGLIAQVRQLLETDDSRDEEWTVAVLAVKSLVEGLEYNVGNTLLCYIIADRIGRQLEEEERWEASRKKVADYLSALRSHLARSLPEQEDLSDDEDEIPDDLDTVFDAYPKITDPIRRPGHLNPYRQGIGAADTIAILIRDRLQLVTRAKGLNDAFAQKLEKRFTALDAQIKKINDEQEKPLLQRIAALRLQRDRLIDKARGKDVDTSGLDEQIAELEQSILKIREGEKRSLREQLRQLYEAVYWISQKSQDDVDEEARKRQVAEFFNLEEEEGFETSFQRSDSDPEEFFDKSQGIPPRDTSHHSEQRILVSRQWQLIRQEILEELQDALAANSGIAPVDLAALLTPLVVTMSINRSSCYTCNAFLVAELLSLWKEIAGLTGISWQQARDIFRQVFTFEVTYSVPYSKVSDVAELNGQLQAAGWIVYQHDDTAASSDEETHEKLALGNIISGDVKKEARKKRRRSSKKDSDEEYSDSEDSDRTSSDLVVITRLARSIALDKQLSRYFTQLVRKRKGGADAVQILTELGFQHHAMPGTGLNCALYSIQHQLQQLYGIQITDFEEFAQFVRSRANLAFGTMIDVLNNGAAVLDAVVAYLLHKNIITASIRLSLSAWSAVLGGGVMAFNNVATGNTDGALHQLTLYYNGVNHFDSLTGGPGL